MTDRYQEIRDALAPLRKAEVGDLNVALAEALDRVRMGADGANMQRLRQEHARALIDEIDRLSRTLAAVEHARDVEHKARRSLQNALKDLCAQHIGGEL